MDLQKLIGKASDSSFWLWVINIGMATKIPFNKPHGIKITKIDEEHIEVKLPYKKSNWNHLKGLHACGLATLAEFSTGVYLLSKIDMRKYRIIMKSINVEYHYQAKLTATTNFSISKEVLDNVFEQLKTVDKMDLPLEIPVHDSENNHLCTAQVNWQVKNWGAVKTKV